MFHINPIGAVGAYSASYQPYLQRQTAPRSMAAVRPVSDTQTTPVQPVAKTAPVQRSVAEAVSQKESSFPILRKGADPVEMAVRSRIQYLDQEEGPEKAKSPQEVMEEGVCQTCKERKYQDESDDPGVSYQTPTKLSPEQAASAVGAHEQEHVVRERAAAQQEGREVVSQSVTLHNNICPECGRVYVSGGTTRTTTRAASQAEQFAQLFQQQAAQPAFFQAIA